MTLDIGFGPLKTRILGPTDEIIQKKKGEELVDMSSPLTLLIVTVSGTIRIIGTFAGVSNSKYLMDTVKFGKGKTTTKILHLC